MLELASDPVKDLTSYKHYEGGKTTSGVGNETGFTFTRRRLGCYCKPAEGASCSHAGWTGDLDRGFVMPARPARGGAAQRVTRQAVRTTGPSAAFRNDIGKDSLCCMPGDEEDETADGESVWFVNALGAAEKNTETFDCGPCRLIKGHYSVPVQWLKMDELTDEHAIFKEWPTEQDRIATKHLAEMPDLKWEKEEDGRFFMSREQYDLCNDQF